MFYKLKNTFEFSEEFLHYLYSINIKSNFSKLNKKQYFIFKQKQEFSAKLNSVLCMNLSRKNSNTSYKSEKGNKHRDDGCDSFCDLRPELGKINCEINQFISFFH